MSDSRIPIMLKKRQGDEIADLNKVRYLVPQDMPFWHFLCVLRKKLTLPPHKALFVFTEHRRLVPNSVQIGQLYLTEKSEDGHLKLTYASENAFG